MDEGTGTSANDSSGGGNTGTLTNSPAWATGKFGKALKFTSSSSQKVSLGTTNIPSGNQNYTMMAWIKPDSYGTYGIVGWGNWGSTNQVNAFRLTPTGLVNYWWGNDLTVTKTGLTDGNWHHIVALFDGTTRAIYVNGVLVGSDTPSSHNASATNVNIATTNTNEYFPGSIDDIRIYNYARTQKQIVEDMLGRQSSSGASAGGNAGSAIGYWKFDEGSGTVANNTGFGGSAYNATLASSTNNPTWSNGKNGKALVFDGNNDYATINTNLPTLTEGSISMWAKRTAYTGTYQFLFTDGGSQFEMSWTGTSNLQFYVNNVSVSTTSAASLNTWYHIVGTFSETGNFQRIYINGVLANLSTYPGDATTAGRYFGSRAGSYPFAGSIDEVKIYNYALTEDEVKIDYNSSSAVSFGTTSTASDGVTGDNSAARSYCVPGDTTSCAAPVAEWKMDEHSGASIQDTSGNGNTGTITGATWKGSADCKEGSCLSFNGTSDFVNMPVISLSSSAMSISAWVKPVDISTNSYYEIYRQQGAGGLSWVLSFQDNGTILSFGLRTSVGGYTELDIPITAGNYTDGSWHYIEAVYDGTTKKIYKDGVPYSTSESKTGSILVPSTYACIGASPGSGSSCAAEFFNGQIDKVTIYDYARTPAQIAYDYNRGAPVAWYKMDECEGGTLFDSSASNGSGGNNGTITIGATGTQTSAGTCSTSGTAWGNGQ
ncbi:hypothetical protein COY32_03180, partial [candidate division WWE3 bacterium CG_4_10_14_0_2_um_filter_41_14]